MKDRRRDEHLLRPYRGCRVYVGGLPTDTSRSDIRDIFSKYRDRFDMKLKTRFAFIEFDYHRDADHAVDNLDGLTFRGRRISVEVARGPRTADKYRFKGGLNHEPVQATWVKRYGTPEITKYKILVKNLSTRIEWQDLKDLMKKAGTVTYALAHKNNMHEGMVCFSNEEGMLKAIDIFNDYDLCGRKLIVEEYYST
ncbi:serine/arginine-rich splicing factor 6 [Lepeophtheirus salmonis]|uniref:Serine-arginine protein 55 n=1 Tax=Lepeophtheirus salmonis TaxID=72036 RepID=D3PIZ0_LEPSM|nr:serine-arginine protein 55-like [Lepeophtheirus salmonis]XP_040578282.1 serine-arginine protein 55-like [Lepeophtheirus salmonis]XP_040578292.1 serine-arginine protein 55-like [Lepeophtheirus salmonis]XP_040578298.1 serine-arginine protein 55-like [Lepeophtheirus salmonis]XP_040578299.1 serine-arginine protein 55-like [Lepeophtheirus salmonis]XP_040578306.1 serine-arginine protein 55-like [Lepeophtheirus salmonis]ADD38526.1 Serine-arginine protein 55 [Lepeophtheirus salmonis]